jgi:HlyD family secretion protein
MNDTDPLNKLVIPPGKRSGSGSPAWLIYGGIALAITLAAFFAWPRKTDNQRVVEQSKSYSGPTASPAPSGSPVTTPEGLVLTTSGYIINRERIELSPRFVGVVRWMGVKKGDRVKKGQIVVLLDDSEQKARVAEAEGRMARAEALFAIATTRRDRLRKLRDQRVESQQQLDDAEAELMAASAGLREARGLLDAARAELEWTVIRSPVEGVVLEKLADENELVSPQSFGGDKGPSTALIAVANPEDLQVEIDVNEADLAKIHPGQECRVTPEAFPGKSYPGYVAEIAPEANRQKGTLQVKVQIRDPDQWLIPELSARVDFLQTAAP